MANSRIPAAPQPPTNTPSRVGDEPPQRHSAAIEAGTHQVRPDDTPVSVLHEHYDTLSNVAGMSEALVHVLEKTHELRPGQPLHHRAGERIHLPSERELRQAHELLKRTGKLPDAVSHGIQVSTPKEAVASTSVAAGVAQPKAAASRRPSAHVSMGAISIRKLASDRPSEITVGHDVVAALARGSNAADALHGANRSAVETLCSTSHSRTELLARVQHGLVEAKHAALRHLDHELAHQRGHGAQDTEALKQRRAAVAALDPTELAEQLVGSADNSGSEPQGLEHLRQGYAGWQRAAVARERTLTPEQRRAQRIVSKKLAGMTETQRRIPFTKADLDRWHAIEVAEHPGLAGAPVRNGPIADKYAFLARIAAHPDLYAHDHVLESVYNSPDSSNTVGVDASGHVLPNPVYATELYLAYTKKENAYFRKAATLIAGKETLQLIDKYAAPDATKLTDFERKLHEK